MAIAAAVREISDSSCRSDLRSVEASLLPPACVEVVGFEEVLIEIIARARMLRPHLGSRLVSAPLTYGVPRRMIANPVISTCTSTIPELSERVGANTSQ